MGGPCFALRAPHLGLVRLCHDSDGDLRRRQASDGEGANALVPAIRATSTKRRIALKRALTTPEDVTLETPEAVR